MELPLRAVQGRRDHPLVSTAVLRKPIPRVSDSVNEGGGRRSQSAGLQAANPEGSRTGVARPSPSFSGRRIPLGAAPPTAERWRAALAEEGGKGGARVRGDWQVEMGRGQGRFSERFMGWVRLGAGEKKDSTRGSWERSGGRPRARLNWVLRGGRGVRSFGVSQQVSVTGSSSEGLLAPQPQRPRSPLRTF